jgi:hypothetical protein
VPCCRTFCAFPWHISHIGLFVPCRGTFCAVPWLILCLPMVHKSKSLFVPCRGTFCAFPCRGTSSLKVFLCHAVAHFVPSCGTWYYVPSCQELQVKNCKSRIASQELQVKNCRKSLLDSLDIFSRGFMNERIFSLVSMILCLPRSGFCYYGNWDNKYGSKTISMNVRLKF